MKRLDGFSYSFLSTGVADVDRAEEALQFAKKYEVLDSDSLRNIKLIELDYSDVEELASTFPRRGKLVIVDGDVVAGGNQADVSPPCQVQLFSS